MIFIKIYFVKFGEKFVESLPNKPPFMRPGAASCSCHKWLSVSKDHRSEIACVGDNVWTELANYLCAYECYFGDYFQSCENEGNKH